MGVVYRAEHLMLRRVVALKLLAPELAETADFRERFLRECRVAGGLWHPAIVAVYDAGELEDMLYIAMQYIEGEDLGTLIRRDGALPPDRAVVLLEQVAAGLDVAHAGEVVHRDVKPENVMVAGERAYVTDFGLTRQLSSQTVLTAKGQFVGTIAYVAPEQIQGKPPHPSADIYAFGCMAYHVLAGSPPFDRDSMMEILSAHLSDPVPLISVRNPELPAALDAVMSRALAKSADERYPDCASLVRDMKAALA
jgi:serine/threonine-protein kinase